MSSLPAVAGFLERNYCYKSGASQIQHEEELVPVPYTCRNVLPLWGWNEHRISLYGFKVVSLKPREHRQGKPKLVLNINININFLYKKYLNQIIICINQIISENKPYNLRLCTFTLQKFQKKNLNLDRDSNSDPQISSLTFCH